jgi:hypothetical protein
MPAQMLRLMPPARSMSASDVSTKPMTRSTAP